MNYKLSLSFSIIFFVFTNMVTAQIQKEDLPTTDSIKPLTERESEAAERINISSLNGDMSLMNDYYKTLMKSFISKDNQSNIIEYSLQFIPKLIVSKQYAFAQKLLEHLIYRIQYYSTITIETKQEWLTTIHLSQHIIRLLENPKMVDEKTLEILMNEVASAKKSNYISLLKELYLGLSLESKDKDSEHLYKALEIANDTQNIELYYLISTSLVKQYIDTSNTTNALNRLRMLYVLFSDVQPSEYYKIKVLIYFSQAYLLEKNYIQAYSSFIRAYEILSNNTSISDSESQRLSVLLSQMEGDFTDFKKRGNIRTTKSFLSDYVNSSN